jgi:hypothetical protein
MSETLSGPPKSNFGIRKDVLEFVKVSEHLLSAAMQGQDLTHEECGLIAQSVMSLCGSGHPWSKSLPIHYSE